MKVYEVIYSEKNDNQAWADPVYMVGETMGDVMKKIDMGDVDWSRITSINVQGELLS